MRWSWSGGAKPEPVIRQRINVTGMVQGVGFRFHAEHAATLYDVTGWVKNEDDGSVTLEVQGTRTAIDSMLDKVSTARFVEIEGLRRQTIPLEESEYGFYTKY